jgi:competence protein ComEC
MATTLHQMRNCVVGFNFLQSRDCRLEYRLEQERERLVLWLPVMFGAGVSAWFILPSRIEWIGAALIFSFAVLIGFFVGHRRHSGRALIAAGVFGLLGLGYIWWRAAWIASPILAYPVTTEFSAQVEVVQPQPALGRIRILVLPLARNDLPQRIRLTVAAARLDDLRAGEYIGVRARLTPPPQSSLPGGYDFARRAWFEGIGAVGTVLGPVARASDIDSSGKMSVRRSLTGHVHRQVDDRVEGVAAALVTGDRGAISLADDEAMRRSGLAHLLSISGLHVTAVVGFVMLAGLRVLGLSSRLALAGLVLPAAAALAAFVGGGYTLLAGAEVPTLRSFIASLLVLVAILLGRDAVTLRLVSAGAMLVLLWRPEAVISASFQLSFMAVAMIVALHEHPKIRAILARRDEGWGAKLGRNLGGLLLTGIAVEIALMPIGLFHFHRSGLYGAFANVVGIPLTTFIIMPAEALGLSFDTLGLGASFWWVAEQGLFALMAIAHGVAGAPAAVRTMPEMPNLAFGLIMGGGIWLLLWMTSWRYFGFFPIALGVIITLMQPSPDLIVSRDGRNVAAKIGDGEYALLRLGRAGYSREMMMEAAGSDAEPVSIASWSAAECNADFCRWYQPDGNGRQYQILASRSSYWTEYEPLIAACKAADIVISDRRLPRHCEPRWLRLDRDTLAEKGGVILSLKDPPRYLGFSGMTEHPWNRAEKVSGNDER